MRRWIFWLCFFVFLAGLAATPQPNQARTRVADGFDMPVGPPDADGYYMSRGFLRYHPGEDWNGLGGGNSDLGAPVYAIANGFVTYARDARMGWGNVVLLRHIFIENGSLTMVDSMYAHLDRIMVREGQQVKKGQQVGTIGTNRGMYTAHLHFEIRKNLAIGINRSAFQNNFTNYYKPTPFIQARRQLPGGNRSAMIVTDTYRIPGSQPTTAPAQTAPPQAAPEKQPTPKPTVKPFRVNRFEDMSF